MLPPSRELNLATNETDILEAVESFAIGAVAADRDLLKTLVNRTTYWVFNETTENFGPGKFVGFKRMDFTLYAWARNQERMMGPGRFPPFLGGTTRKAIERIAGNFHAEPELGDSLAVWVYSHLGLKQQPPRTKWRFVRV